MASPTEMLQQLQERLLQLPEEIAFLTASRLPSPAQAAQEGLAQVMPQMEELAKEISPAGASVSAAGTASGVIGEPAWPAGDFTSAGGFGLPDAAMESLGMGGAFPATPEYGGAAVESPGDEMSGVVSVLERLVDRMTATEGRNGERRGDASMPDSLVVPIGRRGEPARGEGYAGGASPSEDVSNIAGAGGASSRRGFGSNPQGGRYWQPEDDIHMPR